MLSPAGEPVILLLTACLCCKQVNKQARASNTLGGLLQRLLCQLSRPEEAAPALKSHGLLEAPVAKEGESTGSALSHTLLP